MGRYTSPQTRKSRWYPGGLILRYERAATLPNSKLIPVSLVVTGRGVPLDKSGRLFPRFHFEITRKNKGNLYCNDASLRRQLLSRLFSFSLIISFSNHLLTPFELTLVFRAYGFYLLLFPILIHVSFFLHCHFLLRRVSFLCLGLLQLLAFPH